jgi:hypothetical protein
MTHLYVYFVIILLLVTIFSLKRPSSGQYLQKLKNLLIRRNSYNNPPGDIFFSLSDKTYCLFYINVTKNWPICNFRLFQYLKSFHILSTEFLPSAASVCRSGFGGAEVACWPLIPKFAKPSDF